jgi:DNA-directed RNA polymerase specialized sigma24 family protein
MSGSKDWAGVRRLWDREHEQLTIVLSAMIGFGLSREDGEDILQSFALEILPQVVEKTAGLSEADQGKYVRAALRNFVRSVLRSHNREALALARLEKEVSWTEPEPSEALDPVHLDQAIGQLPIESRRAVRAFLGIGREPTSIREIAKELGLTRYSTRKALQDGLLGAALALRQRGALSPIEAEACRRFILDGESLESVATSLGLSVHQVRQALHRARQVIAQNLGKRE